MSNRFSQLITLTTVLVLSCSLNAQTKGNDTEGHAWWQHAVFYEIYPRSFADSNNDGTGDLSGITSKLDYLHELGVDAIWISPFFPSPQVDFGYDVSDYESIDPVYGTVRDFDRLVSEGKKRGIRVILDFVVNHTSDQHKWFLDSKSSRKATHRDWFIWRDGKRPSQPPNNWISIFGGSAWKLAPKTNQYYYHAFYAEQPDLNWRNPAVVKAMGDVNRFWYKRGVAGFRLDAVDRMFEDEKLRDSPTLEGTNKFGDPLLDQTYTAKLPEMHDALRGLRKVADESDAVLIGETWTKNIEELKEYYGPHNDELQMPMNFMFTKVDKLSPPEFRNQINAVESAGGWPVYVISNHDIDRSYNRYGDGKNNDAIAKVLAGLYLTLRGTAIMYYGEEIGMENNNPTRKEDVKDPIGRTGWPNEIGRDGERTPMQWTDGTNAGFSIATPWLPVPASHATHNVASEAKDSNSVLQFYKQLLAMRHTHHALLDGSYVSLNETDPNVMMYVRKYKDEAVLVAINMSGIEQRVSVDLSSSGFAGAKTNGLLSSPISLKDAIVAGDGIVLPPFGVYIANVTK